MDPEDEVEVFSDSHPLVCFIEGDNLQDIL